MGVREECCTVVNLIALQFAYHLTEIVQFVRKTQHLVTVDQGLQHAKPKKANYRPLAMPPSTIDQHAHPEQYHQPGREDIPDRLVVTATIKTARNHHCRIYEWQQRHAQYLIV